MTQWIERRLWVKWLSVALAAAAIGYGLRTGLQLSNDVHLTYIAATDALRVTIYDSEGTRIRRTEFEGRTFKHTIVLPQGHFEAELRPKSQRAIRQPFEVFTDGQSIELIYRPSR